MIPELGKFLVILGALLVIIGVILLAAPGLSWFDKIPGNFRWQKGPVTIYFPLGIGLILSVLLTLLFHFMGRK